MACLTYINLLWVLILGFSCGLPEKPNQSQAPDNLPEISDDSLLTRLQYETFQYFWEGAEPHSGLARERIHTDSIYPLDDQNVVTTGGSGFGVMALLVGVERGFITREEALTRFERIVVFLENVDRFHGAWSHWIDGATGKVKPFSKKDDGGDLVETAFLIQGLLCVRQYFRGGNEREQALANSIDQLWREVEWNWYTNGGESVLYWHWSPNFQWEMNFPVGGYNEALIMYVLAAASPTYSIDSSVYHKGWARNGNIVSDKQYYKLPVILDHYETDDDLVGPLFWAHYSYLGLDPRKLNDRYGCYWQINTNHALIHLKYCQHNPQSYQGYGEQMWGLTSSYSPRGYAGHRPQNDLGVISPTAALSSIPYTPIPTLSMIRQLYSADCDSLRGGYGPYDAFSYEHNWMLPRYLAIDQGPIPVMIENYRTGLLWNLFMSCPEIQLGLDRLGFTY